MDVGVEWLSMQRTRRRMEMERRQKQQQQQQKQREADKPWPCSATRLPYGGVCNGWRSAGVLKPPSLTVSK